MFFPERGQTSRGNEAKNICLRCPVQRQCEDASVTQSERYGIWAGKTKKQYRK